MWCVVFDGTGGNEVVSVQSRADPPVDKFICQTGLHTQCLSTLFGYSSFAQVSSNIKQTPDFAAGNFTAISFSASVPWVWPGNEAIAGSSGRLTIGFGAS